MATLRGRGSKIWKNGYLVCVWPQTLMKGFRVGADWSEAPASDNIICRCYHIIAYWCDLLITCSLRSDNIEFKYVIIVIYLKIEKYEFGNYNNFVKLDLNYRIHFQWGKNLNFIFRRGLLIVPSNISAEYTDTINRMYRARKYNCPPSKIFTEKIFEGGDNSTSAPCKF